MMASAVMRSLLPSALVTSSCFAPVNLAVPSTFLTLFSFRRLATPLVNCLLMAFLWAMTWGKLMVTRSTSTPISLPCVLICSTSSAECSRHLVGMQPTFRQVPPRYCFSITVTSAPSCAARMAATYPPGPPPITMIFFIPHLASKQDLYGRLQQVAQRHTEARLHSAVHGTMIEGAAKTHDLML